MDDKELIEEMAKAICAANGEYWSNLPLNGTTMTCYRRMATVAHCVARESIVEKALGPVTIDECREDSNTMKYQCPIGIFLEFRRARLTREPSKKESKDAVKDLLCARIIGDNVCFSANGYDANILEAYRRGFQQAETRKP